MVILKIFRGLIFLENVKIEKKNFVNLMLKKIKFILIFQKRTFTFQPKKID
jgi:hypothetical protein